MTKKGWGRTGETDISKYHRGKEGKMINICPRFCQTAPIPESSVTTLVTSMASSLVVVVVVEYMDILAKK